MGILLYVLLFLCLKKEYDIYVLSHLNVVLRQATFAGFFVE